MNLVQNFLDLPIETPLGVAFRIACDGDIIAARSAGRKLSALSGLAPGEQALVAAAISEVAHNILRHARRGEIVLTPLNGEREGLSIVARDHGPGIEDPTTTLRSLGLGLAGIKRVMDEFEIITGSGQGTIVAMEKWA